MSATGAGFTARLHRTGLFAAPSGVEVGPAWRRPRKVGYSDVVSDENPRKDVQDWVTGDEPTTGPQLSYLDTPRPARHVKRSLAISRTRRRPCPVDAREMPRAP
ncbi:DUF3072 domain-containing protein [Streptomyces flavidovirens]|uniref:DUF3072 domain-containing protein n=1 Tax=Streptomyces flavidovirens TaxID=67298 RepID=A0ABW6RPB3_9ACTN